MTHSHRFVFDKKSSLYPCQKTCDNVPIWINSNNSLRLQILHPVRHFWDRVYQRADHCKLLSICLKIDRKKMLKKSVSIWYSFFHKLINQCSKSRYQFVWKWMERNCSKLSNKFFHRTTKIYWIQMSTKTI